jgi:hypothetical protein
VEYHFTRLLEKIHGPSKDLETPRPQVSFKISLGIPFFKKAEFIFIIHLPVKVAPPASLLCPYQAGEGIYCLGELFVLLRKNFHANNEEDHANDIFKRPANTRENQKLGIILSEQGIRSMVEKSGGTKTNGLTSIFGGTSKY